MPIGLDPNATTDICLKADLNRPPEQRAYFKCRFITSRQNSEVVRLLAAGRAAGDGDEAYGLLLKALGIGIIGPVGAVDPDTHEPLPCRVESIERVLTKWEMWGLGYEYPEAVALSEVDLKKSASPSGSRSENSAPPAKTENVQSNGSPASTATANTATDAQEIRSESKGAPK